RRPREHATAGGPDLDVEQLLGAPVAEREDLGDALANVLRDAVPAELLVRQRGGVERREGRLTAHGPGRELPGVQPPLTHELVAVEVAAPLERGEVERAAPGDRLDEDRLPV